MTDRAWDKKAERERKAAQREKKRLAALDAGKPWKGLVGEEREQAIRDFYGYAPSETRSQAERQAVADRITGTDEAKAQLAASEEVWGRQNLEAEERRQVKHEELRESLVRAGVKNVPETFSQDSEARAERSRRYAEWRTEYLAGRAK